jgi:hypothetical protein
MGRGACIPAVPDHEAQPAQGALAIGAGNFELTPESGDDPGPPEYGKNEPEDEYPRYSAERQAGHDKKCNRAGHRTAAAALQVVANGHERKSYADDWISCARDMLRRLWLGLKGVILR